MNEVKNLPHFILKETDLFTEANAEIPIEWQIRIVGKVVLINSDGAIALIGNQINDIFLLPGGGIEHSENLFDGVLRECKEETGCNITIISEIATAEDFRLKTGVRSLSHCFFAIVDSIGKPKPTQNEIDIGLYLKWVSIEEALQIFIDQDCQVKSGNVKFYNSCFNVVRDLFFLTQVCNYLKAN